MEFHEIENHARQYLENSGCQSYQFDTISHAKGTNVWTVIAKIPEGKMELVIDDLDGKLLDKTRHLIKIVNEKINISENISVCGKYHFELKEKIYLGGNMINYKNIELIQDEENKNYLKGFDIAVSDFQENTVKMVFELANRLTNYLSLITGIPVEHKRPLVTEFKSNKTTRSISFGVDVVLAKSQDLDISTIMNFLSNDDIIHQHLYQFKKGIEAIGNNDFAQAIRWFFMIIENDGSNESNKYRPLRNVISHEKLDADSTIDGVKVFGIVMKKGEHLNFNDPEVQKILRREANNLCQIIRPKIENEVQMLL